MKARNIRDIKRACRDEEERDRGRMVRVTSIYIIVYVRYKSTRHSYLFCFYKAHEAELPANSVTGKELRNRHAEERQKSKVYIETLQHDNEVLLILKMRQRKLLW